MTFGSSCEPSEESHREGRRRKGRKRQGGAACAFDPFDRVVELCAVRDRSSVELVERLVKEGVEREAADEAVQRACRCGLVDDVRFADGFVRGRVSAGKGSLVIERDLAKHGIDPASLSGWPTSYGLDDESQVERAVALLASHPPKAKDAWSAAYRKLITRGFPKGVASRATRIWAETPEDRS